MLWPKNQHRNSIHQVLSFVIAFYCCPHFGQIPFVMTFRCSRQKTGF